MYYVRTTNGSMMAVTPKATAVVTVKKGAAVKLPVRNEKKSNKKV